MNRPILFSLPADNPEKLADFYCEVFDWKKGYYPDVPDYVLLYSGWYDKPGMNGSIMGRYMEGAVNTIAVADIDTTMLLVTDNGGVITTPRTSVPGLGDFAWVKDPEGNYIVLMHYDKDIDATLHRLTPSDVPDRGFINRPIHFEIPADNPVKLAEFYRVVFDWKINAWGENGNYLLAVTGDPKEAGIDGAISLREDMQTTVNTIGVEDIDISMEAVCKAGGKVFSEPIPIPGVGRFCYCIDPDGNRFGILQPEI